MTNTTKDTILSKAQVARVAKSNGSRVGKDAVEKLIGLAEAYIVKITTDAARIAEHSGRKIVHANDIEFVVESDA